MKVRPFSKVLTSPVSGTSLECSGTIEEEAFVLRIGRGVHPIAAASVGSDQWGEFAQITPSRAELEGGFVLIVEQDFPTDPEFEPLPGCSISIVCPHDQEEIHRLLRGRGIDPNAVNVLSPPDAAVGFSFHAEGKLTGWGRSADFPHRSPTTTH
jgi:hypothetical protein